MLLVRLAKVASAELLVLAATSTFRPTAYPPLTANSTALAPLLASPKPMLAVLSPSGPAMPELTVLATTNTPELIVVEPE